MIESEMKKLLHEMYVAFEEIDYSISVKHTHTAQDIARTKWRKLDDIFSFSTKPMLPSGNVRQEVEDE